MKVLTYLVVMTIIALVFSSVLSIAIDDTIEAECLNHKSPQMPLYCKEFFKSRD